MQLARADVQRIKEAIRKLAKDKTKDPDIRVLAQALEILIT